MTDEHDARPHRWASEWIAVLTLAVAIVALGGGLFTTLNAMEERIREDMDTMEIRIREDMGAMETHIREDVRELRRDVDTLRESTARIEERVLQFDGRVSRMNGRVSRLETRFDEEFPHRAAALPSSAPEVSAEPPAAARRPFETDG